MNDIIREKIKDLEWQRDYHIQKLAETKVMLEAMKSTYAMGEKK